MKCTRFWGPRISCQFFVHVVQVSASYIASQVPYMLHVYGVRTGSSSMAGIGCSLVRMLCNIYLCNRKWCERRYLLKKRASRRKNLYRCSSRGSGTCKCVSFCRPSGGWEHALYCSSAHSSQQALPASSLLPFLLNLLLV